jgi:hypothetical protein
VILFRCEIPGDLLNEGHYIISINVGIPGLRNLVYIDGALELTIYDLSFVDSGDERTALGGDSPAPKMDSAPGMSFFESSWSASRFSPSAIDRDTDRQVQRRSGVASIHIWVGFRDRYEDWFRTD